MLFLLPLLALVHPGALFEANRGQAHPSAEFVVRLPQHAAWFTAGGIAISDGSPKPMELTFPGSSPGSRWEAEGSKAGEISYILGADRTKWVHQAPQYSRLRRRGLYPGVDLVAYVAKGKLEYDLVLAPGADPRFVRVRFSQGAALTAAGEIVAGKVRQAAPLIYQGSTKVGGRFVAGEKAGEFRLELGAYDAGRELVVDPVLHFATYLGGEKDDVVTAVSGSYVGGNTSSVALLSATRTPRTGQDIFFSLLSQQNSVTFISTTIAGGSDQDELTGIALAGSQVPGPILVGSTRSRDFPAFNAHKGGSDGFVFSQPGSSPVGALLIGGSGDDRITAVLTRNPGGTEVGIVGVTDSADLPTVQGNSLVLAGSKDAFFGSVIVNSPTAFLNYLSYVGGSGDDTARALAYDRFGRLWIAGETASADFPSTNGSVLRGPSDAFLVSPNEYNTITPLRVSQLYGGSGEDRIESLSVDPSNSIAAAGITASPDLPFQGTLAGPSDAFLLSVNASSGETRFASYFGGTGPEESARIVSDEFGGLFLAGTTGSADLRMRDPLQARLSGARDAFFAYFDNNFELSLSTYFGGSGNEYLHAISLGGNNMIRLAGETDSPDLPLRNALQESVDGRTDGFIAEVSLGLILSDSRIDIGKDLSLQYRFATSSLTPPPYVKFRSSNPAILRFSDNGRPVPEVVVPLGSSFVWIEALADAGMAEITISAPGFPDKIVPVRLYPTVISVPSLLRISIVSRPSYLGPTLKPYDPANPQLGINRFYQLRDGMPQLQLEFTVQQPELLSIEGPEAQTGSYQVAPLAVGQTQVTFRSSAYPVVPESGMNVIIDPVTLAVSSPTIAQYTQATVGIGVFSQGSVLLSFPSTPITIRSSDPAKLLLTVEGRSRGQAEITLAGLGNRVFTFQAVGEPGQVTVTYSAAFAPEVSTTVTIAPVELVPSISGQAGVYVAGSTRNLVFRMAVIGETSAPVATSPVVGMPSTRIRVTSSNPAVVSLQPSVIDFPASQSATLTAVAPGEATLTFALDPPLLPVRGEVRATVVPAVPVAPVLRPIVVGQNLQEYVALGLRSGPGEVIISIANPELAVVSARADRPGAAEIRVPLSALNECYVQGLAASGSTTLTLQLPNLPPVTTTIRLAPAAIAFTSASSTAALSSLVNSLLLGTFPLDEATGIPLSLQQLRPGVTANIQLRPSGTSMVAATLNVDFPSIQPRGFAVVSLSPKSVGETTFTFDPPPGFATPSRLHSHRSRVVASPLRVSGSPIAVRDAVTELTLSAGTQTTQGFLIKVTSPDPDRLLLSTSLSQPPSATVTVLVGRDRLLLLAKASSGTVNLAIEAPEIETQELSIDLVPLQVGLPAGGYSREFGAGGQPLQLSLELQAAGGPNIVGIQERVEAAITSSAPGVLSVSPARVVFMPNGQRPTVTLTPGTAGVTEIRIAASPGEAAVPVPFTVRGLSLTLQRTLIPERFQGASQLFLRPVSTALRENVILTIVSLDPSRLLLSRTAMATPAVSISVAYGPSAPPDNFVILHGIGAGVAGVRISGEGLETSENRVEVRTAALGLSPANLGVLVVGQNPPILALSLLGFDPYIFSYRYGLPDITIPIVSSDLGVASPSPSSFVWKGGEPATSTQIRAVGPGRGRLSIDAIPGFADPGVAARRVELEVAKPKMSLSGCPQIGAIIIGKDMQIDCSIILLRPGLPLRAVSSNPAALAVSFSADRLGSASDVYTESSIASLSLQALAGAGESTVVLSSPGYEDLVLQVSLIPSAFLINGLGAREIRAKKLYSFPVYAMLHGLSATGTSTSSGRLRPGAAAIPVTMKASDPAVVEVVRPTQTFTQGMNSLEFYLVPLTTGSAVLTLSGSPDAVTVVVTP